MRRRSTRGRRCCASAKTGKKLANLRGAEAGRNRELGRGAGRIVFPLLSLDQEHIRAYWSLPTGLRRHARSPRRPIPKEIVEQSEMQIPEFEPPVCPKCGAADPVLEERGPGQHVALRGLRERVDGIGGSRSRRPEKDRIMTAKNGKSRPATGQLFPQGE